MLRLSRNVRRMIAGAAIAHAVFALVFLARFAGWLQPLELAAYDAGIRARASPSGDARVALVLEEEADLARWGFPLSDERLAQLIERIAADRPAAIGIDKYRDIPVAPGGALLEAAAGRHPEVVWIFKFGGAGAREIPPPKFLAASSRTGFNDFVADPGGVVRRVPIYLDDGKVSRAAFSFLLAQRYLQAKGIVAKPDPARPDIVRLGAQALVPFEADDGGYAGADAAGYQLLIEYRRRPGTFATHSLSAVLDGRAPPGSFTGRIVIFGSRAESLLDVFHTPFSSLGAASERMPGAELQAQVASQLLGGALDGEAPTRTLPEYAEILLLWAACLAGTLIGYAARAPALLAFGLASGTAAAVAASVFGLLAGWWLALVPAAIGFLAAGGIATAWRAYLERAERGMLMHLFSRHVSSHVAEALWDQRDAFMDGGRPRPQMLTASVMFTDIRGFTSVSERMQPAELFEWLDDYLEAMTHTVLDHGGIVNKYIGDGIMAVFGVPVPRASQEEIAGDARNAVRSALAMARVLEKLNAQCVARGYPEIGIRVGIHTGPLLAGSVGGARRQEYTVIGDTVNTASRLESYTTANADYSCRILISETTRALIGGLVEVRALGSLDLKGKEKPVTVFFVESESGLRREEELEHENRSSRST